MDIAPNKENIDVIFGTTTFYIDFYQRHYKWNSIPVKRLLDDIFYKFDLNFERFKENDIKLDKLVDSYSWYYLNTYVTNIIDGKCFIVDGQQRLTTITLILIKLMHLADVFDSKLKGWIEKKIAGQSGYEKNFWMNHGENNKTIKSIYNNDLENDDNLSSIGITSDNLLKNYNLISSYLSKKLNDSHQFESFVFYFLKRLVLINLNVEQSNVPMIFEVINDRGMRLKPYEILKGKLLGEVDKKELDELKLHDLWENQIDNINKLKEEEIDNFFVNYLRAKFANNIADSRKFDMNYHRYIFNLEINKNLNLLHNSKNVKKFLQNDFKYFTNLYQKILKNTDSPNEKFIHVYYNKLNGLDTQFLLILSSCKLEDKEEDEKIRTVSYNVDKLFSLLQLQRSYDSNEFIKSIYNISSEIRNKPVNKITEIFDKYLLKLLSDARGISTEKTFSYGLFKDTGIELSKRFKRYFFARIEKFISKNTNLLMKHNLYDLVKNTGPVNGFHIEHILADNDENRAIFNNEDDLFEKERNRLGALLILKGKDNISSNNENYQKKLKTYANTLYWNETLREDSYKSKLDFKKMKNKYNLNFRPMNTFGPNETEERQKLLYEITKLIWK